MNTATIAKMSARKGWTQLSKDQHLLLVVAIDDFLQRFFFLANLRFVQSFSYLNTNLRATFADHVER